MDTIAATQQLQDTMWNTFFAPFVPWFWVAVLLFIGWAVFMIFGRELAIELLDIFFPWLPGATKRRIDRISRHR